MHSNYTFDCLRTYVHLEVALYVDPPPIVQPADAVRHLLLQGLRAQPRVRHALLGLHDGVREAPALLLPLLRVPVQSRHGGQGLLQREHQPVHIARGGACRISVVIWVITQTCEDGKGTCVCALCTRD